MSFGFFSLFGKKGRCLQARKMAIVQNASTNLCQSPKVWDLRSIQTWSYTLKDIFATKNCEASHGMIMSKLFLSFTQQILEGWFKYDRGITNRFIFSPTYTARWPFCASTAFEDAWFAANKAFLITSIVVLISEDNGFNRILENYECFRMWMICIDLNAWISEYIYR